MLLRPPKNLLQHPLHQIHFLFHLDEARRGALVCNKMRNGGKASFRELLPDIHWCGELIIHIIGKIIVFSFFVKLQTSLC